MPGHRPDRTPLAPVERAGRRTAVPAAVLSPRVTPGDATAVGSIPASQQADPDRRGTAGRGRQRDRYSLPLSTDSPRAAERYAEGLDRLLSWSPGAGASFEQAIAADEGFALAHAALALAAAGDDVSLDRLIDGLRALATRGHPLAESVTLPLVQGIGAFGRGDYAEAVRWLESILDRIVRIGGSNAQRKVFEETLIIACLRAGQHGQAEPLLRKRLGARLTARDLAWLRKARLERAGS
jgi:hypothetical protein